MTLTPDVACAALLPTSQGSHARVALFGHVWFLLQSHRQRHQRGHVGPPFLSPRFPSSPRNGALKGAQRCQCSTCFARSVTKLLLDLARCPKLPAGISATVPAESSKPCWTSCPWSNSPAYPGSVSVWLDWRSRERICNAQGLDETLHAESLLIFDSFACLAFLGVHAWCMSGTLNLDASPLFC